MTVTPKYILCLFTASIIGCVDPISFETDPGAAELVFYGNYSQLDEAHLFNVSQTSGFGLPVVPVTNATIVLMDDQGNSADYLDMGEGQYQLPVGRMPGIPGRSYHVEITLPNGAAYFSTPQLLPEPIQVGNIYFNIEPRQVLSGSDVLIEQTFLNIYIDTPLQDSLGATPHLRWTVEEVYSFTDLSCGPFDFAETCYFIDPIDDSEVLLFKNEGAQDCLTGYEVRSRLLAPLDEFTGRHYFLVRQYAISDEEFDFWNKIDAVANQSGDLFDVQPAKVLGNIYERGNPQTAALGYFSVNGQSRARTFTTPFNVKPYPLFTCMDASFARDHFPECCNCFTKEGNHIERPAYWDED